MRRRKKKVLLVLHYPPPVHGAGIMGDIIRKSAAISKKFKTRCIKIDSSSELGAIEKVSARKLWYTIRFYIRLSRAILFFRPDVVHYFASPRGPGFYRDFLASVIWKRFRLFKCPSIFYHFHGKYQVGKPFQNMFAKWFFTGANIVVLSDELLHGFKALPFWKTLKFFTLPNTCVDLISEQEFKESLVGKDQVSCNHFLYLSNMIASKGYLAALDVASYLKKKGVAFRFSYAGAWVSKNDKELFLQKVESLGLESVVEIRGKVDKAEKKELLLSSHFLIFPTLYPTEAFPLVLVEALQCGVVPICYKNGATPSIVDSRTGFLVSDNKIESLKKVSLEATGRRGYVTKSLGARDKYLKNYTQEIFEQRLSAIWNNETEPLNLEEI